MARPAPTASLRAETIDAFQRRRIDGELLRIEQRHGIRILYACESGSRAWGFSSTDSDYDVRFVYVHPTRWYLPLPAQRDVIEYPVSDDLDVSGWDLRKALYLVKKGNATLAEWLQSPIVYREDVQFGAALRQALQKNFAPERAHYHYIHTARHKFSTPGTEQKVGLKKFLYTLRPLLAARWIEQRRSAPPTLFGHLVDGVVDDVELRQAIAQLVDDKRTLRETDTYAPSSKLINFVEVELARLLELRPPKTRGLPFCELDALLCSTIERCNPPEVT